MKYTSGILALDDDYSFAHIESFGYLPGSGFYLQRGTSNYTAKDLKENIGETLDTIIIIGSQQFIDNFI